MRQTVPNLASTTAVMAAFGNTTITRPVPEHAVDKPEEVVSKRVWARLIGLIADGVKVQEAMDSVALSRYTLEGILRTDPKKKDEFQDAKIAAIRRCWDLEVLEGIFTDIAKGTLVKHAVLGRGLDIDKFYALVLNDPVAKSQYDMALQMQCEGMADEIIEISDHTSDDQYLDQKGVWKTDNEVVNRSRLRVDTRKWKMATLHSKRFGNKTQSEGTLNVIVDHAARLEEARARARTKGRVVAVQSPSE